MSGERCPEAYVSWISSPGIGESLRTTELFHVFVDFPWKLRFQGRKELRSPRRFSC